LIFLLKDVTDPETGRKKKIRIHFTKYAEIMEDVDLD
jgi:hypothetical protein